jgi:hypothetical protein
MKYDENEQLFFMDYSSDSEIDWNKIFEEWFKDHGRYHPHDERREIERDERRKNHLNGVLFRRAFQAKELSLYIVGLMKLGKCCYGVSFLFSIKDYLETLYILSYDAESYDEAGNTIEFSKLEILKYFCVMFKSENFLHGGGIHSADDPRIFIHFQEKASDKDFVLFGRGERRMIKKEKSPGNL